MAITKLKALGVTDGTLTNTQINASAAIAKTKLAALDIVNADVNASAAIAATKVASDFALIHTIDASNQASVTFTSSHITDAYMDYKVVIRFGAPVTNGQALYVFPSIDNGSNYNVLIEQTKLYRDLKSSNAAGTAGTAGNSAAKIDLNAGTENTANKGTSNDDLNFIPLGQYFEDKDIKRLLPYEGDYLLEGRHGHSIRFGSTTPYNPDEKGPLPNHWSIDSVGDENSQIGDPITIIRNGQPDKIESQTWIPITEDINSDKSSIYLTTNQLIPIKVASSNYTSYDKSNKKSYTPSNPKDYQQNQIILNSGRLLFNAYDDSILLSSLNSINLNSKGTVNIDVTKKFVVSGEKNPQIYLGNSQDKETEPLLLGDETVKIIDTIMSEMINVYEALGVVVGNMAIPLADVNSSALSSLKIIKEKQKELENLKQKNIRIRKNP